MNQPSTLLADRRGPRTQVLFHAKRCQLERDLAARLKPDLMAAGASRLYCVLASESDLQFGSGWAGVTSPVMAAWLRGEIGNRWEGDGPAFMLNDAELNIREIAATAVHEVAHIVCERGLFCPLGPAAIRPSIAPTIRAFAAQQLADPSNWSDGHDDPRFIRAMFHLRHWLQECGWTAALNHLLNWKLSTGVEGNEFCEAIGDEPERLRTWSMSDILKSEPPTRFARLCCVIRHRKTTHP